MVSMATHYAILKNEGLPTKNTHISAATHPRKLNLVSNYFLDIVLLPDCRYANNLVFMFMNFNENIRNE